MTSGTSSDPPAAPRPISIIVCPNCAAANRIGPSARGSPHCGTCKQPLPWVVSADESTFEVETRASPIVVVDLWAPWCGPCRIIGPMLEDFAREVPGRVKIVKVNVDENPGLAARFDARSIPTLVILRDGQLVDRIVGAPPRDALVARLRPHLKPPKSKPAPTA